MAHDVFVSHSSKNKITADAICHALEENGVRCWIAPRDIPPGSDYGAEIIRGIRDCTVFLLVFSDESNNSVPVQKEVERAVLGYRKTVIPFRLENTPLSDGIEYYLGNVHWIDAYPDDTVFANLITAVKNALGMGTVASAQAADAAREPQPASNQAMKVIYPTGAVQIPDNALRFKPNGIATIKLAGGQTFRAYANTLLYSPFREIGDGLFSLDSAKNSRVLFSSIKRFTVGDNMRDGYQISVTDTSGNRTKLSLSAFTRDIFVFLECDGAQTGHSVRLPDVKEVNFDWAASPPALKDYMLVSPIGGTPMVVPQNFLFCDVHVPGNYGGSYNLDFAPPLESPPEVRFSQMRQLSVIQRSTVKDGQSSYEVCGLEIKLLTDDILKNEFSHSGGNTNLYCVTNLGPVQFEIGKINTLQHLGSV